MYYSPYDTTADLVVLETIEVERYNLMDPKEASAYAQLKAKLLQNDNKYEILEEHIINTEDKWEARLIYAVYKTVNPPSLKTSKVVQASTPVKPDDENTYIATDMD